MRGKYRGLLPVLGPQTNSSYECKHAHKHTEAQDHVYTHIFLQQLVSPEATGFILCVQQQIFH